jgi:hypothetical protein
MICNNCQTQNNIDSSFCKNCGKKLIVPIPLSNQKNIAKIEKGTNENLIFISLLTMFLLNFFGGIVNYFNIYKRFSIDNNSIYNYYSLVYQLCFWISLLLIPISFKKRNIKIFGIILVGLTIWMTIVNNIMLINIIYEGRN